MANKNLIPPLRLAALLILAIALAACEKPRVKVSVPPTPDPNAPAEVGHTLYVIKHFSATTPGRLHGFPTGRPVTVLAIEGGHYLVTDGVEKGRASRDSFTRDAAAAANLAARADAELAQARQTAQQTLAARQQAAPVPTTDLYHKRLTALRNEIETLNFEIANIRREIGEIHESRNPNRGQTYYRGGEKRLIGGGSTPSTYALEENLKNLTSRRDTLAFRLRHLQRTGANP